MSDLAPKTCAIIGGGPAGLAAALSLKQYTAITPTVYELRAEPSSIGGAINLTPCGILQLQHLGIKDVPGCDCQAMELSSMRTGSKIGAIPLASPLGPAKRTLRADLQKVMLDEVQGRGISVVYSARLSAVEEVSDGVRLRFSDGTVRDHGFVLGCDGIFSTLRKAYVDPEREPEYTGPAAAFAVLPADKIDAKIPFESVGAGISKEGYFMMAYCNAERSKLFFGVVLPFEKIPDARNEWVIWREDKNKTLSEVRRRFKDSKLEGVAEMIDSVDELFLYPLVQLPNGGAWHKGKALLLGDAAHAMLPQGESSGFAIEDAILLGRVFSEHPDLKLQDVFRAYERTRQPRITSAWEEANKRAGRGTPGNWFTALLFEWIVWGVLRVGSGAWVKKLSYDVRQEKILL